MYQVRNTIAIDEEYHYKSNNFKYHKYAKGNEKNYAVCVSSEEYYCRVPHSAGNAGMPTG